MRFIDNHDTYRFLRIGEPEAMLRIALAYLLFSIGIPMTYYGTEQGFRQNVGRLDPEGPDMPPDPENRQDQFADGSFKSDSSSGDKFDVRNPIYLFLKKLADIRNTYVALRRGDQWVRWSDPDKSGLFAFSRIYQGQEVLVAINFSSNEVFEPMWVDTNISPAGTVFHDLFDNSYHVEAKTLSGLDHGSRVSVAVPPLSVRVLVRETR